TAAIVAVSAAVDPASWRQWVDLIRSGAAGAGSGTFETVGWYVPVALAPRLVAAGVVVVVGAVAGRRWLLPVGVVLAMPVLCPNSSAALAACVPLWLAERTTLAAAVTQAEPARGLEAVRG